MYENQFACLESNITELKMNNIHQEINDNLKSDLARQKEKYDKMTHLFQAHIHLCEKEYNLSIDSQSNTYAQWLQQLQSNLELFFHPDFWIRTIYPLLPVMAKSLLTNTSKEFEKHRKNSGPCQR
eukprot:SAG31_NODE_7059_length_1800_cov_2.988830_2_plen_125_part_00